MPKMKSVPFATQEGNAGITQNSNETLINMFCEISPGRSNIVRRQRPCLRSVYAVTGEKRAIERHKGLHYLVIGSGFYTFDGTTLSASLGTLSSSSGRCTIIFNDNDEAMIADGINGYFWDGATLASVTKDAGMNVGTLAYLGGYGVASDAGTGKFYSTVANDFSDFNALDFATAEANPDPLYRAFADHNELILAGERTIEIWQLSGLADFPFAAVPTAKIERGILGKFTLASVADTIAWLGDDRIVYRGDGYRATRISTHAIETLIATATDAQLEAAYALVYTIGGHTFYTLTCKDVFTAQYNFTTGLWNRCTTYGSDSWDIIGSNGKVADYVLTAAGICELTFDVNQDESTTVVRTARSAPGDAEGARITMSEFFADCEVGRAALGVTPTLMFRVARDGETFGNTRTASLGTTGNYQTRAVFRGLGQGRKPVIELSFSANARFAIMDTKLNASVGNS
jgi:hypothetical protein